MPRIGTFPVQFLLVMLTLGLHRAEARDFLGLDISSSYSQRGATFGTPVEVVAQTGMLASQMFGFGIGRSSVSFLLQGDFSFHRYSASSVSITEPDAVGFGGSVGFQFGQRGLVLRLMGGMRNSFILTQPSAGSVALTPVLVPEVSGSLRWIALEGRNHEIGLGALGGYQLSGSNSNGSSQTSAMSIGGELCLDFSRSKVPLTVFGHIQSTTIQSSAGNQTNLVFGGGLRLGATISRPSRSER
jgi:hypothetical protein